LVRVQPITKPVRPQVSMFRAKAQMYSHPISGTEIQNPCPSSKGQHILQCTVSVFGN